MDKAYDLTDLGQKIAAEAKKDGLELAEEAIKELGKAVYFGVKAWAKESAAMSESPIDDFMAKFYDYADAYVLPQLDKVHLVGEAKAPEAPKPEGEQK